MDSVVGIEYEKYVMVVAELVYILKRYDIDPAKLLVIAGIVSELNVYIAENEDSTVNFVFSNDNNLKSINDIKEFYILK